MRHSPRRFSVKLSDGDLEIRLGVRLCRHGCVDFNIQTKAPNTIEQSVIDGTLESLLTGIDMSRNRVDAELEIGIA